MKSKILTTLLLSAFLFTFAQDNKPTQGDIGIHYNVNFGGSVQQSIGVSGIITKNLELGGALLFSYSHTNTSTTTPTTAEGNSGSIPVTAATGNKGTTYSLAISPYLLYHFAIKSNLDLYVGPAISIGFSNSNNHSYSSETGVNYLASTDLLTSQPPTVNMSLGVLLGCQYFFYKNLALGVQAGLSAGYSTTKGNITSIRTNIESGSDNPISSNTSTSNTTSSDNNHTFNLSTMASAGVSLAFYFSRGSKK